jgi:tRNA-guanine family transglycosylase
MHRTLHLADRELALPAFLPVTTFGGKFRLDEILRPYLPQFSPAVMVSHYYAQKMRECPAPVTFIDSGGFASLFATASAEEIEGRFCIRTGEDSFLDPKEVLAFQQEKADIGATLDFIIPPDSPEEEARIRQDRTLQNALWAIRHLDGDLRLYASIQAWDSDSAAQLTEALAEHSFAGFALGGMVPRISKPKSIFEIVSGIRKIDPHRPLHVFGIGSPRLIKALFDNGVDSADSSSFVRSAVSARYLNPSSGEYSPLSEVDVPSDLCPCPVCRTFDKDYLQLEGELNTMALALHNLTATMACLNLNACPSALTSA